jgi:hypothetical protein
LDWSRWYKKATVKSAHQIFGAELRLSQHPDRLFLDKQCRTPFPLAIPPLETRVIHRVVVALGASRRVEKYFAGNSRGSLMLASWLRGPDHVKQVKGAQPFTVGHVDPSKGFVHVFDDVTLDIVLSELDTIADFVQYLTAKIAFLQSCDRIHCAGEEAFLLAFYL